MNEIRGLSFDDWPLAHRDAFLRATDRRFPRARARARNWAEDTCRSVKSAWGLWLEYCIRQGLGIERQPADTITQDPLEVYIRELLSRVRYSTAASYLRNMGEAVRVMQPYGAKAALKLLRAAERDLTRASTPVPDELTEQVEPSKLYESAIARMDERWDTALTYWRDALAYCDALMIVIVGLTLMRRRTVWLTSRDHLRFIDDFVRLSYAPAEVKTRKRLLRSLPPELTRYVEHGLEVAETLARRRSLQELPNLWRTRAGTPMSRGWLGKRLRAACQDLVGVPLGPQRMRRLGATSIHRFLPRHSMTATSVLQHESPQESFDHYVKTGGGGAAIELYRLTQAKYGQNSDCSE